MNDKGCVNTEAFADRRVCNCVCNCERGQLDTDTSF